MNIQIYEDAAGEIRYRKVAGNGEVYGDGYTREADARRGAVTEIVAILKEFATAVIVDDDGFVEGVDEDVVRSILDRG